MIQDFKNKTAVLTGAGSGFGLECARIGAARGMNLVLVDVQQDALDQAEAEIKATGAKVMARRVDVSDAEQMAALADDVQKTFGAPHFVFNNAGVGSGGLIWENSVKDWEWVLGVNLWGVVHGVRLFTPMMLAAAKADPAYQGHIVNTASMAGLLTAPNMGIYNVSKHAVVSLTETLYQDLKLVTDQVSASVLCPYFVPTGISQSHRNRPAEHGRRKAHAEPDDRSGHERQGGELGQGLCGRGGAAWCLMPLAQTSSTSTATPRPWAMRSSVSTPSWPAPTRSIRSRPGRTLVKRCARNCAPVEDAWLTAATPCSTRPSAAAHWRGVRWV